MQQKLLYTFILLFSVFGSMLIAQETNLKESFKKHNIVTLNTQELLPELRGDHAEIHLTLEGKSYHIALVKSNIIAPNYQVIEVSEKGSKVVKSSQPKPFNGYLVGTSDSRVSLTFNDNFIYGYIRDGSETINIEPLSHFDENARAGEFVTYFTKDVIDGEYKCGADDRAFGPKVSREHPSISNESRMGECFEVEWAIASDFLMYEDFNESVGATENHNIGVANNVQTNYDDEFADEIQFLIVEQQVFTTEASDPFTDSNIAENVLDSFTGWGPSGFNNSHDVGSIWTGRNFAGGTIGVAWLSAVCTSIRYNALENFTSNSVTKRVMVAHELGHNFSASHDPSGSPTIMAPSVNTSTSWSSQSINQIQNFYDGLWCLGSCSSGTPPTAVIEHNVIEQCVVGQVQFTSASTGNPSSFNWTFPGGNPSSSTEANPLVTYAEAGVYDVTLEVSNASGSDTEIEANLIEIQDEPLASFIYETDQLEATFESTSTGGAQSFFWDFGDGSGFSFNENPVYEYAQNGTYTVVLTASNDCGSSEITQEVTILADAVPSFTSQAQVGCQPFTVQYFNNSEHADSYLWTFEGGTPATSTDAEPSVVYAEPGQFDVTLVATNAGGSFTELKEQFITVNPIGTSDFSYTTDGSTVSFMNNSQNANSYFWNFGDGNESSEMNPTHTYAESGEYTVTLVAENDCQNGESEQLVFISLTPVASFSSSSNEICPGESITFNDTSNANPTSWSWTFPGGTPSTSTEQNPTVTYAVAGTYDVTLVATNAQGSGETIAANYAVVQALPVASMEYVIDGLNVSFTSTATNTLENTWNFGDGNNASLPNPTHTYSEEGIYQVSLLASGNCGEDTVVEEINLYTQPTSDITSDVSQICVMNQVAFMSNASSNTTSYLWTFEGGTPSTSTEANPTVTYNTAGTFDVTLVVSNPGGSNTQTWTDGIEVLPLAQASFTSSADQMTISFMSQSSNATSYQWSFGDGNTSTEANPTHTYAAEGIYTVNLVVSNACSESEVSSTIEAYAVPTAGATASANTICENETISFSDGSSTNVTAWSWTFEGGTPATSAEQNPTITYNTPGQYNVTLTVTAPGGTNTVEYTDWVNIMPKPEASFVAVNNMQTVTFTNNSTDGDSFAWNFGDGNTSTEANPTHTYAAEGNYDVVLQVTNACGVSDITNTIAVNSLPSANGQADATEVCVGDAVQFTDLSSDNVTSWQWSFPGATPNTSTERNPQVVYTEAGVYDVSLTVSAPAGDDEITLTSYINVGQIAQGGFTAINNMQTVTFTNQVTGADTYSWNFGDGNTSTMTNPVHTYEQEGEYNVVLTATNRCGDHIVEQMVAANALPSAGATASATEICQNESVSFADMSSDNVTEWLWEFEGGTPATSTEQNPEVTYATAGQFNVKLTVTAAAGSNEVEYDNMITVAPLPTAAFDVSFNDLEYAFAYTGEYATSWLWDFGDGNTSTEANPTHTYAEENMFDVSLTTSNACGEDVMTQSVNVVNNIIEIDGVADISVYPIPTSDALVVDIELLEQKNMKISLINIVGQEVYNQTWNNVQNVDHTIDVSDIAPGSYMLSIASGSQIQYVRVLIQ